MDIKQSNRLLDFVSSLCAELNVHMFLFHSFDIFNLDLIGFFSL